MVKFEEVRQFLLEHKEELAKAVADSAGFQQAFAALEDYWNIEPVEDLRLQQTWQVMRGYGPVWQALTRANLVPEQRQRGEEQPAPAESEQAQPQAQAVQPRTAVTPPQVSPTTADRLATWNQGVVIGKEIITGCMGLLIVGLTLLVALAAIFTVRNVQAQTAVKDVLLFLNGLVGVVLGYYFGRVPGEMQATKAEGAAKEAQTKLDTTLTEVETIVDQAGGDASRGGGGLVLTPDQVRQLREVLRRR